MWNLGNRASVVLISLTFGCVLIYNAWGAILALAVTLLVVVYVSYSLLVNDSVVSPHAYRVVGYLREAIREIGTTLRTAHGYNIGQVRKLWRNANRYYRERFPLRMDRRRNYQLSSDSYAAASAAVKRRSSSSSSSSSSVSSNTRFSLLDQLSPIPRFSNHQRLHAAEIRTLMTDDRFYCASDHEHILSQRQHPAIGEHCTSTPVKSGGSREEDTRNGDANRVLQSYKISPRKFSTTYSQNQMMNHGENLIQFSLEGSPWSANSSSKTRPRPGGVKTVQTVAGPLLASTRYNIDPKVYTDVSSPGLTTRLTKYATDAKSKLNYQSQYSTGQFPKVNLQANPIPLLSPKVGKMRMPVTVRVAPPDVGKYSSPERQKILTNMCHMENKSPMSVVQVLREISLKRHASTEDVGFDVAKKQKTDGFFNDKRETILEENKQKRSRDDSKSDDDLSFQNKSVRPAKRTKTRSCYDILNSLSSSIRGNVTTTGIKRKAVNFSRSGTPDFEKHFKSLEENALSNDSPSVLQSQNLDTNRSKSEVEEIYSRPFVISLSSRKVELSLVKGILKPSNVKLKINSKKTSPVIEKTAKNMVETNNVETVLVKPVTLTEKLFMRAEPKQNERLKELIEEPGNIKAKFAKDNVEEIKREDLRNMRQTGMKARLQSMFDAISGKAEKSINPHVVIQADDITVVTPPPVTCSTPVSCVTLNSSTTTTNVNTTPLSTAAIVPSGLLSTRPETDTKTDAKISLAFSLPSATSPIQPSLSVTNTGKIKEAVSAAKTVATIDQTKAGSTASTIAETKFLQKITSSSTPNPTPIFSFEKTAKEITSTSSLSSFGATSISNASTSIATVSTAPTSTDLTTDKMKIPLSSTPVSPKNTSSAKIETCNIVTSSATINSSITANTRANTNSIFTFGGSKLSSPSAMSAQTSAPSVSFQTVGPTLSMVNKTVAANIAGFTKSASNRDSSSGSGINNSYNSSNTSSTSNSIATATPTTATASLFSFGSNNITSQLPKSNMLIFGQSSTNKAQSATNAFGGVSSTQTSNSQVKSFDLKGSASASNTTSSSFIAYTTTIATSAFKLPPSAPTFSVSTSSTSSTSTLSANKPLFVFGVSTTSNTTPAAAILPAATSTKIGTTDSFGAISNTVPIFGTPTTVPQFGALATTTVSQFGISTTSIFSATSTTTAATTTCIFGETNNSQPLFGAASMASPTTAGLFVSPNTTPSIFTPTTNAVSSLNSAAASSGLFSNVNASATSTTATTTASSLLFGSNSPIFGQTKSSTSLESGSGTSGVFGSTATPLFGSTTQPQSTTASTFGIAANVSTSIVTPDFNTTTPAFGSPSISSVTNAQTASAFGGTSGMFGSTDSNTSSGLVFPAFSTSSSANTFGTPQSPATLTFGSGASSSGTMFGDNKSPFEAAPTTTTGFGTSNSSIPTFGANNTNNNNNTASSMFVFGGNQKEGQQNTSFSFGSNFNGNNNSAVASSVPFQFGSASSKPASTGFNFTPPSATPTLNFGTSGTPTFNPSTPGMFSIGSGSTAPRSRTARTRKPR